MGISKAKRLEEAKTVLEDMSKVGTYLDHVAYSALIDGFMKQGCVDEALKLKDEMFVNGVKLNVFTYISIIFGLCRAHRFEEAIGVLTGMKERGTPPDVYCCYSSLIIGLCKEKKMEQVQSMLIQMKNNGVKPNALLYCKILPSSQNAIGDGFLA
ncbi:unnamed protein product [Lactuca virosa]|uniref:Pentatricopeptide repeat-containing protein n=1 Tax=Lactuca virosa TaxID=75947 RepID=A0AAU9NYJ3_9ASTR|nr:unnamed protein product [Lactuca virosa]